MDHPFRSRVSGHVEVEDLPASMCHDEEAVKDVEGQRRHREEIECSDYLAVILEKGKPSLCGIAAPAYPVQVASYSSLGDHETELLQFSVNAGRTPAWIVICHAPDQRPDFLRDLRLATARPGSPSPVKAESGTVPRHDRLRLDNDEDVAPARP